MTPERNGSETPSATAQTIRADYDWTAIQPSTAVIETVAVALDQEPTATQPLYEAVDPDALNTLIRSADPDPAGDDVTVTFRFAGLSVTVQASGAVVARPEESRSAVD